MKERDIEKPRGMKLAEATDSGLVRAPLERLLRVRFGEGSRVKGLESRQLQRRIIRYRVDFHDAHGEQRTLNIIGKLFHGAAGLDAAYEKFSSLHEYNRKGRAFEGDVRLPDSLGTMPEFNLLIMSEVPGEALRQRIRKQTASQADMLLLADAAVALHQSPLQLGERISLSDLAAGSRTAGWEELAEAHPDLAPSINRVMSTARDLGREQRADDLCQNHGDLHLGQIHVHEGKAWLVDLDALRLSDPAFDLTEIYTNLKRLGGKRRLQTYVAGLRDAFLQRYFASMDWAIAGRVPIYEALIHIRRAVKMNRVKDEDDWQERIRTLVSQAEACIQAIDALPPPHDLRSVVALYDRCPGAE